MEISFKDEKIQKVCNIKKEAIKKYGPETAKKLRQRLENLRAASNLEMMLSLPGRCHELKGERKKQLSLDLKHPLRLIFEAMGENLVKVDGGLNWSLIKAIRILGIEDTHE